MNELSEHFWNLHCGISRFNNPRVISIACYRRVCFSLPRFRGRALRRNKLPRNGCSDRSLFDTLLISALLYTLYAVSETSTFPFKALARDHSICIPHRYFRIELKTSSEPAATCIHACPISVRASPNGNLLLYLWYPASCYRCVRDRGCLALSRSFFELRSAFLWRRAEIRCDRDAAKFPRPLWFDIWCKALVQTRVTRTFPFDEEIEVSNDIL